MIELTVVSKISGAAVDLRAISHNDTALRAQLTRLPTLRGALPSFTSWLVHANMHVSV
jgi:hypothetical protein